MSETEKRSDYIKWDEFFMSVAQTCAKRSKDPNTQVGACIVSTDNKILGTGYNGFPNGCSDNEYPWASEGDFLEVKYTYVVHAEANAILNSTWPVKGSTLYSTLFPCHECAKLIIQAGIKKIVYSQDVYIHTNSCKAALKMLSSAGVYFRKY